MKKKTPIPAVLLILLTLSVGGCKSLFTEEGRYYSQGKSAARSRRYDVAVESLVRAVTLDREYKKALLLLDETYPEGIDYYRNELNRLGDKDDLKSLDYRASLYDSLVSMEESVKGAPPLKHPETGKTMGFPLYGFDDLRDQAAVDAAEGHYQKGIDLAQKGDRESAKAASKAFLKALDYVPDYKDAPARELDARADASQQLLFLPFQGDSYKRRDLDGGELLLDKITSAILGNRAAMEYTTIIDRSQLNTVMEEQKLSLSGAYDDGTSIEIGKLVSANMAFAGNISQIDWDDPRVTQTQILRKKEVPATEKDLGRAPEKDEKITVEGKCTFYKMSSSARMLAGFKLIDIEKGSVLINKTFSAEAEDVLTWLILEGDERVLTVDEKKMLAVTDREVKSVDELVVECVDSLSGEMAAELAAYLK